MHAKNSATEFAFLHLAKILSTLRLTRWASLLTTPCVIAVGFTSRLNRLIPRMQGKKEK